MKSKSLGSQRTRILFGFDRNLERFVPSREPSKHHEACIEADVSIPDYITPEFFIEHYYKLTFIKRYGFEFNNLKTEKELYRLMSLSGISLFIAVKLLMCRRRTAFLTSCKSSLIKWINEEYDFNHPWSGRQLCHLEKEFQNEYKIKFYSISKSLNVISSFT